LVIAFPAFEEPQVFDKADSACTKYAWREPSAGGRIGSSACEGTFCEVDFLLAALADMSFVKFV